MTTKPLFNFRLGEDTKEEWQEYVDDHWEYQSIAELVRGAVNAEINRSEQDSPESPGLSNDIQQVQDDLERVKKDVRWLRNQRQDSVDISDLAQRVQKELVELPTTSISVPSDVDDEELYRRQARASRVLSPDGPDDAQPSYTADAIADMLDAEEDDVEEAINHLKDQFIPITSVELEGETHYFMEGS